MLRRTLRGTRFGGVRFPRYGDIGERGDYDILSYGSEWRRYFDADAFRACSRGALPRPST